MPLDGLNDEQRAAAEAVRGPVCILAGAGTGKTTTITRRIAHQITSGTFDARDLLALTFTDRAAGELRRRLAQLGVRREVRARTFHAEALAQVAHFLGSPSLLASKAAIIGPLVRRLPRPYRFKATKDVAGEIERAKNRRVGVARYLDDLDDHVPPLPSDLMVRLYGEYEDRKRRTGKLDFEDLLEHAIRLFDERPDAAERIRTRYKAFSVDEYQDVNLLQQTLLEAWLGGRDEVCVVGDDYQSIYGFTGAGPGWLLDFPRRYPNAQTFTLTRNYRSTPQVLAVANRLTGSLGGREKILVAQRPDGPERVVAEHAGETDETNAIVREIDRLASGGTAFEEIAILYRINARSDGYEEALAAARIPYQVRDGAFLRRPGPRAALHRLNRADRDAPATDVVPLVAADLGWHEEHDEPEGTEEATRLADLGRLVRLAEEFEGTAGAFIADLHKRFTEDDDARGVVLSTYHRAKGLEWDAVFLPRLEERELPFALSKSDEDIAEERRLLYVGITRARTNLYLSWARSRDRRNARPSRFLSQLVPAAPRASTKNDAPPHSPLFDRLREWRRKTAAASDVPAYVVFHDATLRAISDLRPATMAELSRVAGVGPAKLDRYGEDVLDVVRLTADVPSVR